MALLIIRFGPTPMRDMKLAALLSFHHPDVSFPLKNRFMRTLKVRRLSIMLWALVTFQMPLRTANPHIINEEATLSANELVVSNIMLVSVRCFIVGRFELI